MIVERQSVIDAPTDRVWARVVTPEGINDELRPWMTMSMPRGAKDLTVDTVPVGTPVGRCWMRLFGILPFDYDNLMIAAGLFTYPPEHLSGLRIGLAPLEDFSYPLCAAFLVPALFTLTSHRARKPT